MTSNLNNRSRKFSVGFLLMFLSSLTTKSIAEVQLNRIDGSDFPDHVVSLVYDDGPDVYSYQLAQYLAQQHVVATFNVVADWGTLGTSGYLAPGYSTYLKDIISLGHRLGNHTYNHGLLDSPDAEYIRFQLKENGLHISQYVSNGIFTFTPPGNHWEQFSVDSVIADTTMAYLTGPYVQISFAENASDWSYAQMGLTPEQYGQDFVNGLQNIRHGLIFNHDRNEFAVGSDFALRAARVIVPQLKQLGYVFVSPTMTFSKTVSHSAFTAADWMAGESYYGTFKSADVNGDGIADVCARGASGILCGFGRIIPSAGPGSSPTHQFTSEALMGPGVFDDAGGWGDVRYSSTIQYGDVNGDGKADVIARSSFGLLVALSDGVRFGTPRLWSKLNANGARDFSNFENIWLRNSSYYGTFRAADINGDGKADICARGPGGIICALSNGISFEKSKYFITSEFSDAGGWADARYALTIQFGDMNGDGKADVMGRNSAGILVAESVGSNFSAVRMWSYLNGNGQYDFSDTEAVWQTAPSYYNTFRSADINGDGKSDLCARAPQGIVCAMSNGTSLTKYTTWEKMQFSNANGWDDARYASTIMISDANHDGRADVIAKNSAGLITTLAP